MADDVAAHDKIKKKETDDLNALLQSEADNRAIAGFNKTKDAAIAAADAQYIKIVIDSATAEATKTQNILDEMAKQLTAVGETYSREKDLGTEAAQGIQDFIDGINKDVEITVHTHYVSDGGGDVGHNAGGTSNWRGGLTWVGEQGPELVNLPRGAQVSPNGSPAPNGGGNVTVDLRGATIYGVDDLDARVRLAVNTGIRSGGILLESR